jgi:putative addiction module component (TIGR02574 family)
VPDEQEQDNDDEFPLTPEQAQELDRRYAEFLANPEEGYSLEEVQAMLEARRRQREARPASSE